jgi:prepilin-type N-terminal cleavage/methylation domain-containing protein
MSKRFSNFNRGMTYVELIVVLSIMGILSATVILNGRDFNKRIEVRNLADEIALKIVEAQKSALAGKIPSSPWYQKISDPVNWKPAYGVCFDLSQNDTFIYFGDFDNSKFYGSGVDCGNTEEEYIKNVNISPGYIISDLKMSNSPVNKLSFVFTRSNSSAFIYSANTPSSGSADHGLIKVESSSDSTIYSTIRIYASGRIEIN